MDVNGELLTPVSVGDSNKELKDATSTTYNRDYDSVATPDQ